MYLLKNKKSKVAHLWDGENTECQLFNNTKTSIEDYSTFKTPMNKPLCCNCLGRIKNSTDWEARLETYK